MQEGDGDDVLQLKQSLLAITATFTERVEMLECKLEMVTRALQEAQQATAAGAQPPAGPLAGEGQEGGCAALRCAVRGCVARRANTQGMPHHLLGVPAVRP